MDRDTILLTIPQACELAVNRVVEQVKEAGLTVLRTFDLQIGRGTQTSYPCPVHGYEKCNCQVVVLLVYVEADKPVTLVAHGDEHETVFSLVDTPQQRPEARAEARIRSLVTHQQP